MHLNLTIYVYFVGLAGHRYYLMATLSMTCQHSSLPLLSLRK